MYRPLKTGEVVKPTDEYIPFYYSKRGVKKFFLVEPHTVGQEILDCNAKYYRRPLHTDEQNEIDNE